MRLLINDKNVNLTNDERKHIEKKMAGMEKFLNKNTKLEIYLNDIREGDKKGVDTKIEAVTKSFGKVIRVSETGAEVRETVDRLSDRLLRALRKRKEKRVDRLRRTKAFLKRAIPTNWFRGDE
jgi:ribosomal subunit interface protein